MYSLKRINRTARPDRIWLSLIIVLIAYVSLGFSGYGAKDTEISSFPCQAFDSECYISRG